MHARCVRHHELVYDAFQQESKRASYSHLIQGVRGCNEDRAREVKGDAEVSVHEYAVLLGVEDLDMSMHTR